jgi:hypothetical protein
MTIHGRVATLFSLALIVSVMTPTGAAEQPKERPPIRSLSSLEATEKTRVMVLAGPHTGGLGESLTPAHFQALLDVLDAWGPDAIAVERLGTSEILAARNNPAFKPVLEQFVGTALPIAAEAQAQLKLDAAEAAQELLAWRNRRSEIDAATKQQRTLISLAAHEVETAILYWRSIEKSGHAEGLPESMRSFLRQSSQRLDERVSIGVALAERALLSRIWSIDSHADKDLFMALVEDLTKGIQEAGESASIGSMTPYRESQEIQERALAEGDLLPLYDFVNSERYGTNDVKGQFDLFNRLEFPNDAGRSREAAWDERNLRIAANIRRVTAYHPGGKILVIIGAGHKPFLDKLLATSLDVNVVQLEDIMPGD